MNYSYRRLIERHTSLVAHAVHLQQLKQGQPAWNTYVQRQDPTFAADLTKAKLVGIKLSRANLYRARLSMADLYGAKLFRADLSGADLYGTKLCRADLSGADLCRADLSKADLHRTKFSGAVYDDHTIWPKGFDPKNAGALKKEVSPGELSTVEESAEPALIRVPVLDSIERKRLATSGIEKILAELQDIADSQRLEIEAQASLESEIGVLIHLLRNPDMDVLRTELTIRQAFSLIGDQFPPSEETIRLFELVEGLGEPDPMLDAEQLVAVAEEITACPNPCSATVETEKTPLTTKLRQRSETGLLKAAEQFPQEVAKYLPATGAAGVAVLAAKYGGATRLVKGLLEFILAALG